MKKFKKSLFFSLIFALLGAFVFAGTPSFGAVYASIDNPGTTSGYLQKQSAEVASMNTLGSYQLYNSNTDTTKSYYSVVFTNNSDVGGILLGSTAGQVSFNATGFVANGKLSSTKSNRAPRVSTIFSIGSKLLKAGQNGYLTMQLSANIYNGTGINNSDIDTSKIRIENGTKDTSDYTSFSSSVNLGTSVGVNTTDTAGQYVTATINNPTQSDFRALFVTERSDVGGLFDTKKCYLGVIKPTITITSSDKTAPTINSYDLDTSYANTAKNIVINVVDNGAGVDYITLNGKTATSVTKSADEKTASFTFAVSENGEYKIVAYDNVGNYQEYTYEIDCFDYDAPSLVSVIGDREWSGDNRILTITVNDAKSGVASLLVDGVSATLIESIGSQSVFNFTILSNGDYQFTMTDNLGNSSSVSYVENQFDIIPPSLQEITFDCTWFKDKKTLYISVIDNEIGVDYITVNGDFVSFVEQVGNVKTFEYAISDNGDYEIVMYDLYGNFASYTYTESLCDTSSSSLAIDMPTLSNSKNVNVISTISSDNKSLEKIYYTLDNTMPNVGSNQLLVGESSITFDTKGDYVVKFAIIDEVGNVSEVLTCSLKVDDTRYSIIVNEFNCCVEVISNTLDGEIGDFAYYGEEVSFYITESDGTELYKVLVNGVEQQLVDGYTLICTGNIVIEVKCRQLIDVVDYQKEYVYRHNAVGIDIEYVLSVDAMIDINYTYQLDGVNVESEDVKNVGEYTIVWSYSSNDYVGSGKFDVRIVPKTITAKAVNLSKVYGSTDPVLTFESDMPAGEQLQIEMTRQLGENVGEYLIRMTSYDCSDNFVVEFIEGKLTINCRKIYVFADNLTKYFDSQDPMLTYKIYGDDLLDGDELSGCLTRAEGENVGEYSISLGTLSNDNYSIGFAKGKLTIIPRELIVNINNVSVVYGDSDELTYSIVCKDDAEYQYKSEYITGNLVREDGENVGEYNISIGSLSSDNYKLVVGNNGVYSISPKPITVTAVASSKIYRESEILEYVVEENGLLDGDYLLGEITREKGEDVGSYSILQGTLQNDNYIINFVSNNFTITPAPIEVILSDNSKIYGEEDGVLSYRLVGLKSGDELIVKPYRESGEDAGEYIIDCEEIVVNNYYIASLTKGMFTIHKATIVPSLSQTTYIYSKNGFKFKCNDFPFEVSYVVKQNGIVVSDNVLNAGEYQVQILFDGNNNYEQILSDSEVVTVKKQLVYLTLGNNKFIYDGILKFPEFYYDASCGLDESQITFIFDNNAKPIEVGEYGFKIVSTDANYECTTRGNLVIADSFRVVGDKEGIIECVDATFDDSATNLKLIETYVKGKFNEQKILTSCSFENVTNSGHVYTIRLKAKSNSDDIYVYQLNEDNTYRELVITKEDGYYVFKVDDLNDTYIVTEKIEPIPVWVWLVVGVTVLVLGLVSFAIIKTIVRKKRVKVNNAPELDTYNLN